MTAYAETSAVLRWLFVTLRASPKVACSRLTLIESHRAIRRAVALEDLVEANAAQVRATLAQASARWAVLEVSSDVASRAEQAFPVEPVRTLDAVHLASALLLRHLVPDLLRRSREGAHLRSAGVTQGRNAGEGVNPERDQEQTEVIPGCS